MKYIFRYSILSFFGENEQITIDELSDALSQTKFPKDKYPINQLLQLSRQCIEKLLRCPQKATSNIIKESYDVANFSDLDVSELGSIWDNQKHFLFKEIIKKSTKSANNFDKLGISIKSKIASKYQNKQNSACVTFSITSVDANKQPILSEFQLTPEQSKQYVQSLKQAESMLDQILS